jgi:hypothetical protein
LVGEWALYVYGRQQRIGVESPLPVNLLALVQPRHSVLSCMLLTQRWKQSWDDWLDDEYQGRTTSLARLAAKYGDHWALSTPPPAPATCSFCPKQAARALDLHGVVLSRSNVEPWRHPKDPSRSPCRPVARPTPPWRPPCIPLGDYMIVPCYPAGSIIIWMDVVCEVCKRSLMQQLLSIF